MGFFSRLFGEKDNKTPKKCKAYKVVRNIEFTKDEYTAYLNQRVNIFGILDNYSEIMDESNISDSNLRNTIKYSVRIMSVLGHFDKPLTPDKIKVVDDKVYALSDEKFNEYINDMIKVGSAFRNPNGEIKLLDNTKVIMYYINNFIKEQEEFENTPEGKIEEVEKRFEIIKESIDGMNSLTISGKRNVAIKTRLLLILDIFEEDMTLNKIIELDKFFSGIPVKKVESLVTELVNRGCLKRINNKLKFINMDNYCLDDLAMGKEEGFLEKLEDKVARERKFEEYNVSGDIEEREAKFDTSFEELYNAQNLESVFKSATSVAFNFYKSMLTLKVTASVEITDDDGRVISSSSARGHVVDDKLNYNNEVWRRGYHILSSNFAVNLFPEERQSPLMRLTGALLFSNVISKLNKDDDNSKLLERYGVHFGKIVNSCMKIGEECTEEDYCQMTGMYLNFPNEVKAAVKEANIQFDEKKLANLTKVMNKLKNKITLPMEISKIRDNNIDLFISKELEACSNAKQCYRGGKK